MTKLSLLDRCVIEEFLHAYSKKIKAALNQIRGESSFLLKIKKKKRKGVIAEKNLMNILLNLVRKISHLKLAYAKRSLRAYIPAVFSCSWFENLTNVMFCFGFFPPLTIPE